MGKVNEARDLMQKVAAAGGHHRRDCGRQKVSGVYRRGQDGKQLVAAEGEVQKGTRGERRLCARFDGSAALCTRNMAKPSRPLKSTIVSCAAFPIWRLRRKHLALLYAQDEATITHSYELTVKARKLLPDDPSWPSFWPA